MNTNSKVGRPFILGTSLLVFILFQHVIPTVLLFLSIPLNPLYFPLGFVFGLLWLVWFTISNTASEEKLKSLIINTSIYIGAILFSILFVSMFYDSSFDGQFYQQVGAIYLKEGWNPVKTQLENEPIINHYAQGAWVVWGSAYSFLGKIELSKYVSFTLIFSSFFLVLAALKSIGSNKSLINYPIAVILAFNPVSIYQSVSFYLDGLVSSTIIILLSFFVLHYRSRRKRELNLLIIITLSFLANLKFTGVGFAIVFMGGFVFLYLLIKDYKQFVRLIIASIISIILGVGISGFHPYVKNTRDFGHPFYPLNEQDLMENHGAVNFKEHNRVVNLFVSVFSRSEGWISPTQPTKWKIPFDTTDQGAFMGNDARVGGFGSLFSAIMLVSIILVTLILFRSKKDIWVVLYLLFILFFSVIIVSAAWWARYVPQFFIIPVVITIWALIGKGNSRQIKILGAFSVFLFFINAIMIANANFSNISKVTREISQQIEQIGNRPIKVDFTCFGSMEKRFSEAGIHYSNTGLKSAESLMIAGGQNMAKFVFHDSLFTQVTQVHDSIINSEMLENQLKSIGKIIFGESIRVTGYLPADKEVSFELIENEHHIKTLKNKLSSEESSLTKFNEIFIADRDYSAVSIKINYPENDTIIIKDLTITINKFKDSNSDDFKITSSK